MFNFCINKIKCVLAYSAGLCPSRVCVCVCVCVCPAQSQGRADKAENNGSLCADRTVPQITHTSLCSHSN